MAPYEPDKVEAHEHDAWEGAAPLYVEHVANLTAKSGQLERCCCIEPSIPPVRLKQIESVSPEGDDTPRGTPTRRAAERPSRRVNRRHRPQCNSAP